MARGRVVPTARFGPGRPLLLMIEVNVFSVTRVPVLVMLLMSVCLGALPRATSAAGGPNSDTAFQLSAQDVYIAPAMQSRPFVHPGDAARIRAATQDASRRGVPTKVGVIGHYPKVLKNPTDASQALRNFMDFSGVLILVTPKGMGISSDEMSNADIAAIQRRVQPQCRTTAAGCAIRAIHLAVPRVLAIQSKANRNAAIFWLVSVGLFGLVVLVLVFTTRRKRASVMAGASPGASPTPTGT